MKTEFYDLILQTRQTTELSQILDCNQKTDRFGLVLTQEEVEMLLIHRKEVLETQQRIEFGESILPKLIYTFCDSPYLDEENYADTLAELMEIFYLYKNETLDLVTDEELLNFMVEQFNHVCYGDTQYLSETCLERFARAVRNGYQGFYENEGKGIYEEDFSEETHWERELYDQAARELME